MLNLLRKAKNQKGFTLVELMVVVVIIGILVAIAIPIYNQVTARAELGAIESNLRTINGAVNMIMMSEVEPEGGWEDTDFNATLMAKYITDWSSLSPGTYTVIAAPDASGAEFVGQVTVAAGVGGLDAGDYYLLGSTVTAVGGE